MCFKRNRKKAFDKSMNKVLESKELLDDNIVKIKTICEIASESLVKADLDKLCDKIAYSSPSRKEEVKKCDKKIFDRLDDLKILVCGNKSQEKIEDLIKDIEVMLIERNANI